MYVCMCVCMCVCMYASVWCFVKTLEVWNKGILKMEVNFYSSKMQAVVGELCTCSKYQ